MTVFCIILIILLLHSIKYIIKISFRGLICHIVCFSSLIIIEVIAKNVNKKYLPVFFLQICKNVKLIFFTFFAINSKPIGLQKRTIWQINRLDLINIIYFIIFVKKMTSNRQKMVIYHYHFCLNTLYKASKMEKFLKKHIEWSI